MATKLGKRQRGLLLSLGTSHGVRLHGIWHPGCGWHYGGVGQTLRLCQGLEARGLVELDRETATRVGQPLATCFKLTPAGEAMITTLKAEGASR